MLDVTKYLKTGSTVYLKLSDSGEPKACGGKSAFLRRIRAYGVFSSGKVFVKLSNTSQDHAFALERLVFRRW